VIACARTWVGRCVPESCLGRVALCRDEMVARDAPRLMTTTGFVFDRQHGPASAALLARAGWLILDNRLRVPLAVFTHWTYDRVHAYLSSESGGADPSRRRAREPVVTLASVPKRKVLRPNRRPTQGDP
jgi:hypothetical protein